MNNAMRWRSSIDDDCVLSRVADFSLVLTLVAASGAIGKFGLLVVTILTGKTMYSWNELTAAIILDIPGLVISGGLPFSVGYLVVQNKNRISPICVAVLAEISLRSPRKYFLF